MHGAQPLTGPTRMPQPVLRSASAIRDIRADASQTRPALRRTGQRGNLPPQPETASQPTLRESHAHIDAARGPARSARSRSGLSAGCGALRPDLSPIAGIARSHRAPQRPLPLYPAASDRGRGHSGFAGGRALRSRGAPARRPGGAKPRRRGGGARGNRTCGGAERGQGLGWPATRGCVRESACGRAIASASAA